MAYYGGGFYNTIAAEAAARRAAEARQYANYTPRPRASLTTGALPGAPSPTDLAKQATGYTTGVYVGSPFYKNIEALKAGIVPSDVKTQLTQAAAERGVGIGSYGGPQTESSLLRALGLTSLGLQEQAIKDYATVIGAAPGLNLQTLYETPSQKAAREQEAELARLAREQGLTLEQMREQYGLLQSREAMAAQEAARRAQWEQAILGSRATGAVLDQYLRRYSPTPSVMPGEGGDLFGGYDLGGEGGYTTPFYGEYAPELEEYLWGAPESYLGGGGWEFGTPVGTMSPEQSLAESGYYFE